MGPHKFVGTGSGWAHINLLEQDPGGPGGPTYILLDEDSLHTFCQPNPRPIVNLI